MTTQRKSVSYGLKSMGKIATQLTHKALCGKDLLLASILHNWPLIVGKQYADQLHLEKISFPLKKNSGATLHISVPNSSMALMTQHLHPLILDRVNQFSGQAIFQKIALKQKMMPQKPQAVGPKSRVISPLEQGLIDALLNQTPEGDLKEALKSLGESLYVRLRTSHE